MEIMDILLEDDDIDEAVIINFLLDSDSSSSEEEFELVEHLLELHKMKKKSCKEFLDNSNSMSKLEFLQNFRINQQQALTLINGYKQSGFFQNLINNSNSTKYSMINEEKAFLVFLYFAGHPSTNCKDVAKKFNLITGVFLNIIANVCLYLNSLSDEAIVWPNAEEQLKSKSHYFLKQGLPDVIGCIGTSNIAITKPLDNYLNYWDSDNDYRFVVQGVCNEDNKFIDVFIAIPGLTDSSMVFKNSPIYKKLNNITNTEFFIIASSNYTSAKYLICPYNSDKEPLTQQQLNFNKKLEDGASSVVQTFILMKRRFRQLHHLTLRDPSRIVNFIKACCVLHNLADESDQLQFPEKDDFVEVHVEDIESNDGIA